MAGGFYIIWNPHGARPPKVRHATLAGAKAEAERLARENPGQEFYVLASQSRSVRREVHTEDCAPHDLEIPF